MKTINVSVPDDIYNKLQDLKINNHVNISSFIASAVKEKLEKENKGE
jgi:post-segregation antitoxin (ccd killing protein)